MNYVLNLRQNKIRNTMNVLLINECGCVQLTIIMYITCKYVLLLASHFNVAIYTLNIKNILVCHQLTMPMKMNYVLNSRQNKIRNRCSC